VLAGVEFEFRDRAGRPLRGIVSGETLQRAYGAAAWPDSWLATFENHRAEIVASAQARRDAGAGRFGVIVL